MSDNNHPNHSSDDKGLKTTSTGGWVLADPHSQLTRSPEKTTVCENKEEVEKHSEQKKEERREGDEPILPKDEEKKQEESDSCNFSHDAPEDSEDSVDEEDVPRAKMASGKVGNKKRPEDWNLSFRNDIKEKLEAIATVATEIGLKSLNDEITRERIPYLLEGKFTVVLLGEFNHGKSTVVNALMGENVLPTGITPTTSVITHLIESKGDFLDDTKTISVKMRRQEEKMVLPFEQLDSLIRKTDDDSVEYVELQRTNPFLSNGLTLVDTPGVNDISKQKVEITYGYLPRADVIIYVLDATQILKKSEIRFLKEKLMKSKHDHVIFVLGKIDSLSPQEAAEVESYARTKLGEILGNVQLHAFSARNSLNLQLKGEAPDPAFSRFKNDVLELVDKNRSFIVFESSINACKRYLTQVNQNLAIRKAALTMEVVEINERLEAVQARYIHAQQAISDTTDFIDSNIHSIISTSINNLHEFTKSFQRSLPREIETSTPADIQTHLPHFIQTAFKEWVEEEGRVLTNRLESLAIEVIEVTNQTMADTIRSLRSELGLSGDVDLNVDTLVYDVSVFALGTAGFAALFMNALVGGLLTLATPILAYYFRSKVGEKVKAKAKEEGIKAIEAAAEALEAQLRDSITSYGDRLKAFVESAGDHLFKQISETLQTVRDELENNQNVKDLETMTEKELKLIHKLDKELDKLSVELENIQKLSA